MQSLNVFRRPTLFGISLVALLLLFLNGCGGGGGSDPGSTNISTGVPMVWDQAQATWDNIDWQ